MIKTKLEDQSEEIKVSIKSGLDEQNEILEASFKEMIDQNNEKLQQVMNGKFQNIRQDLTTSFQSGLNEQNAKLQNTMNTMNTKIEDQDEKMERFFERLVQNFEQLLVSKLKEQQEVFELRFEEQEQKIMQIQVFLGKQFGLLSDVAVNEDFLTCPVGWERALDTCVRVSNEKANFDLASEKCQELDGRLYEPSHKNQNDLVASKLYNHWIGIKKSEENSWVYLSTNENVPFTSWRSGRPDNRTGNEDCVEMGQDVKWNDLNCDKEAWFICETKLILRS